MTKPKHTAAYLCDRCSRPYKTSEFPTKGLCTWCLPKPVRRIS